MSEERRDNSKIWDKLNNIHSDIIEVKGDIKAVKSDVEDHETILRGANKTNGIIGDMRDVKTTGRAVKWFAGLGGSSGIFAGLFQMFGKG